MNTPTNTTSLPPWKRPGAIGWWDEEFESKESNQATSGEDTTLLVFNDVQVIENTTTQPDSKTNSLFFSNTTPASGDGLAKVTDKVDATFKIFEPASKVVAETVTESASAITELVWKDIFGASGKAEKTKKDPKKEAEAQRIKELKIHIQQWQAQLESGAQKAQISERAKVEQAMVRTGVSIQQVEGSVTVSNIFWVALQKTRHHAGKLARKMIPGAGKGKGKQGASLTMNLSAQEGQSMVSSAGAIASAG